MKALERELKLRVSLRHSNLLLFHGICSTNLGTCMVSSYMPNGNASVYLDCHPEVNAVALLSGVANGLNYLHSCWPSITHGDVRGENILVSSTGEALLADHRLSSVIESRPNIQVPYGVSSSISALVNLAGIRWAAPEIVCKEADLRKTTSSPVPQHGRGSLSPRQVIDYPLTTEDALIEVVTPMSDVWSFGMTIYEVSANFMLT